MLRHTGKNRTPIHNLRLAIILSSAAGMVNICGVLHLGTLTTNVTGHFAFFAEQFVYSNYMKAVVFFAFITAFLAGAFLASFFVELISIKHPGYSHIAPMFLEIVLLVLVAMGVMPAQHPSILACILLFSMGMQNSLVTRVSSSVVRTTHLTGLFTDLGIELSQLIFAKTKPDVHKLKTSLFLRSMIIFSFFTGGVTGGYLYLKIALNTLYIAAFLVLCALMYDNIRYQVYFLRRKIRSKGQ